MNTVAGTLGTIIVTGGAGFIGSNVVHELNRAGETEILVVDNLSPGPGGPKFPNLAGAEFADFLDKREFRRALSENRFSGKEIRAILHNGACSNTLEDNGEYMIDNNFAYSKEVLHYAIEHGIPLVYASTAAVYGRSQSFAERQENERPLNVYAFSKLCFDKYLRRLLPSIKTTVVGLRYFNVYGARETHKGRMASVIHHFARQLRETGKIRMFEGSGGYADGEQRRDFIYVGDLALMNLHFGGIIERDVGRRVVRGIFNAGTGTARSFNDVAKTLIRELGRGEIEYIRFPEDLKQRYQHFTQAEVTALREAGWQQEFTSVEDGIHKTLEAES